MKRILTIQDISCLGKCSITVTLPVISAMGVECTILPTALLSSHTMFPDPYIRDLGDCLAPVTEHWRRLGIHFDAIYTGYLGTDQAVRAAGRIISEFGGPDTLVFIDPVMGDHGKLYKGFDASYAALNLELCRQADILVPNITEACLMAGLEMPDPDSCGEDFLRTLLLTLAGKLDCDSSVQKSVGTRISGAAPAADGIADPACAVRIADPACAVHIADPARAARIADPDSAAGRTADPARAARIIALTGVSLSPGKTGVYGLQVSAHKPEGSASPPAFFSCQCDRIPVSCHGTGDLFSSVTAAGLMRGLSVQEAFALAADYTAHTIKISLMQSEALHKAYDDRFGVAFEFTIPWLTARLEKLLAGH